VPVRSDAFLELLSLASLTGVLRSRFGSPTQAVAVHLAKEREEAERKQREREEEEERIK
jgi:hypothetical protein